MPETLRRTSRGIKLVLGRRDGRWVTASVASLYLVVYLYATRALVRGTGRVGVLIADDPWALLFKRRGTLSFEPIARLDVGVATLLVSPIELGLAMAIAGLVGLNLGLSYLAWRQPAACGISPGAGVAAAVPALLSGSACCAPVIFIALGIQASGLLVATVDVLVPVSVLLLGVSLVLVGRRVEPTA